MSAHQVCLQHYSAACLALARPSQLLLLMQQPWHRSSAASFQQPPPPTLSWLSYCLWTAVFTKDVKFFFFQIQIFFSNSNFIRTSFRPMVLFSLISHPLVVSVFDDQCSNEALKRPLSTCRQRWQHWVGSGCRRQVQWTMLTSYYPPCHGCRLPCHTWPLTTHRRGGTSW